MLYALIESFEAVNKHMINAKTLIAKGKYSLFFDEITSSYLLMHMIQRHGGDLIRILERITNEHTIQSSFGPISLAHYLRLHAAITSDMHNLNTAYDEYNKIIKKFNDLLYFNKSITYANITNLIEFIDLIMYGETIHTLNVKEEYDVIMHYLRDLQALLKQLHYLLVNDNSNNIDKLVNKILMYIQEHNNIDNFNILLTETINDNVLKECKKYLKPKAKSMSVPSKTRTYKRKTNSF